MLLSVSSVRNSTSAVPAIHTSRATGSPTPILQAVGIGIPRFAPIAAAAVCMVLSTVAITAPSVSLEGRTIWLSQSLPVTPWQVLRAKLAVHLWVGGIPALLCGVAVAAALRLPFPTAVMTVILPLLFTLLQACFGLFVNLLHPNLTWVSEMTPIKQSLGVLFSLLGGWGYAALLGVGGYFLTVPVPAWVALLVRMNQPDELQPCLTEPAPGRLWGVRGVQGLLCAGVAALVGYYVYMFGQTAGNFGVKNFGEGVLKAVAWGSFCGLTLLGLFDEINKLVP